MDKPKKVVWVVLGWEASSGPWGWQRRAVRLSTGGGVGLTDVVLAKVEGTGQARPTMRGWGVKWEVDFSWMEIAGGARGSEADEYIQQAQTLARTAADAVIKKLCEDSGGEVVEQRVWWVGPWELVEKKLWARYAGNGGERWSVAAVSDIPIGPHSTMFETAASQNFLYYGVRTGRGDNWTVFGKVQAFAGEDGCQKAKLAADNHLRVMFEQGKGGGVGVLPEVFRENTPPKPVALPVSTEPGWRIGPWEKIGERWVRYATRKDGTRRTPVAIIVPASGTNDVLFKVSDRMEPLGPTLGLDQEGAARTVDLAKIEVDAYVREMARDGRFVDAVPAAPKGEGEGVAPEWRIGWWEQRSADEWVRYVHSLKGGFAQILATATVTARDASYWFGGVCGLDTVKGTKTYLQGAMGEADTLIARLCAHDRRFVSPIVRCIEPWVWSAKSAEWVREATAERDAEIAAGIEVHGALGAATADRARMLRASGVNRPGSSESSTRLAEDAGERVREVLLSAVRTAQNGEQGRREYLGRLVRKEWIKWAREQPSPKASWLVPWEGLSEPDKEVDRRIGERLYSVGVLSVEPVTASLEETTPLTAAAIDAWADRFSAAMSGVQDIDVTARLVGEARRWLDRCAADPLATIELAEAHVSRGRMLDMRTAPLTEAEAHRWGTMLHEQCVRFPRTSIAMALAAASRGDIPDAVRATPSEAVLLTAREAAEAMIDRGREMEAEGQRRLREVVRAERHALSAGGDIPASIRPEAEPAVQEAIRGLERVAPVAEMAVTTGPTPGAAYARCCVAALVFDPADRLLLIRSRKPGRGWELPGGKVNAGELWREALRREVREEAGLDIVLSTDAPRVLDGQPVQGAAFTSIILIARARAEGEPVAGDDAAEARWFAIEEIPLEELSPFASTAVVRDLVAVTPEVKP